MSATTAVSLDGGTILLAIATDRSAYPAAALTAALAAAHGASPHVVHATGPSLHPRHGPSDDAPTRAVRATLATALGAAPPWPVHVVEGPPAAVIVREAAALDASLVVLGMRHHGPFGHLLRDETTLHVARTARCPVLAVAPPPRDALRDAPRAALVGVDFGHASTRAAQAALRVLARDGTLTLVHVEPPAIDDVDESAALERELEPEDGPSYARGVDAAFDRLTTDLAPPPHVTVACRRIAASNTRGVGEALLAEADRIAADLIAIGSRRHDWSDRLVAGSVAQALVRDGRHSLLVVPASETSRSRRLDG